MIRRSASEILRNLEIRVARLEGRADGFRTAGSRYSWMKSLFSVNGGRPSTGLAIFEENDQDPEITELLEEAIENGISNRFNMAEIVLIKAVR